MESLKNKNSVYYSYAIINFMWYFLCFAAILTLATLLTKHAFDLYLTEFNIQIPIDADQLTIETVIDPTMLSIESASANLNADYIMNNHFGLYIGILISVVIGFGLFLFGFFQLRMILKSAWHDKVFSRKNIRRLKIIAGLIIAFKPFEWIIYRLFVVPIDEMLVANEISISLDLELGSFVYGLLLFALAAVFEKGHDMYQELKLTV